MSEMPFGFTWCYQAINDGNERRNVLAVEDQKEVPPLDIEISNLFSDKYIAISAIEGVSQADENNYHFKLAFSPGTLADPNQIDVKSRDWSIKSVSNVDGDSIYLLWTGLTKLLFDPGTMKVILTGVAAQSVQMSTTTDINISWQFAQGGIQVMSQETSPEAGDYDENITLTLNLVKSTGESNIPLYVGFVNCNKVLNTNGEASSLQLRLTNMQFPTAANPDITFNYGADTNLSSQLVVTLEVGTVENLPWALGTQEQVSKIAVSIAGDQWVQNGDLETIEIGGVTKALRWTFIPQSGDVVLAAQETILINLKNIVTSHPTGETNLYLNYQYVPGYQDGQFVCQIEKAPLTFDEKVGIGTSNPLNELDVNGAAHITSDLTVDGLAQVSGLVQVGSTAQVGSDATVGGSATINGSLKVGKRIKDETGYVVPVGTIVTYIGDSAPEGWFLCQGQEFDTTQYPELSEVLGNSKTIPDLRDRFLVGAGNNYTPKDIGGKDSVTLTVDQMPKHNHYNAPYVMLLQHNAAGAINQNNTVNNEMAVGQPNLLTDGAIQDAGGDLPHENRPPYYAINYIIKA